MKAPTTTGGRCRPSSYQPPPPPPPPPVRSEIKPLKAGTCGYCGTILATVDNCKNCGAPFTVEKIKSQFPPTSNPGT